MPEFIVFAIIIALITTFIVLFISKFPKPLKNDSIRDMLIMKAPKLISLAAECDFCTCFWVSAIVSVVASIIVADALLLICPMLVTPIARLLL